jgi:hypothetical protein
MSDINQIRLTEKNRVKEALRMAVKYNDIDTASLARFRSANASDPFIIKQTEKLTAKVEERGRELIDLEERLVKLESGELDEELLSHIKENTKISAEKHNVYLEKKAIKKKEKAEDSAFGKKMHDLDRKAGRQDKSYFFDSSLKHFNKAEDTLPDWMKRDLDNMPNNEGFVWKNVQFYGRKPRNKSQWSQVTEARKGMKIITRWCKDRIQIVEKQGRNPEVIVSDEPRKDKHG